jgi:cytoskeletal protein CcmA (bactofilin family)
MLGRKLPETTTLGQTPEPNPTPNPKVNGSAHPITLLTIVGETAKMEGKFTIADSIQIECEVGGELNVGGKLVIGEKGVVNADVQTVDAVILGVYEGNMVASGNVEIATTGRVRGNIRTDSLVISKGGFFNGNVVKIKEAESASSQVYVLDQKVAVGGSPRAADIRVSNEGRGNDSRGGDGRGARVPYAVEEER